MYVKQGIKIIARYLIAAHLELPALILLSLRMQFLLTLFTLFGKCVRGG